MNLQGSGRCNIKRKEWEVVYFGAQNRIARYFLNSGYWIMWMRKGNWIFLFIRFWKRTWRYILVTKNSTGTFAIIMKWLEYMTKDLIAIIWSFGKITFWVYVHLRFFYLKTYLLESELTDDSPDCFLLWYICWMKRGRGRWNIAHRTVQHSNRSFSHQCLCWK